jgi:hypothetical protein
MTSSFVLAAKRGRMMKRRHSMTRVSIFPAPTEQGEIAFRAVSGDKYSQGPTAGAALDALTAQLSQDETGTLVIVQSLRPDKFFSATQQHRLIELMNRWRTARDQGADLPSNELTELKQLIEAELQASAARAAALAQEWGQ